jgi:hypothetical protein
MPGNVCSEWRNSSTWFQWSYADCVTR